MTQSRRLVVSLLINSKYLFQSYMHSSLASRVLLKNNLVVSSSTDGAVKVWDMEKHEQLWELDHEDKVWDAVLRDNQLITCCEDMSVRILDLLSGNQLHRLEHPGACVNCDLSPNKSLLAVACSCAVVLWNLKTIVKIKQFELGSVINDVRFSPSGDRLIVGLQDGEIFKIDMN